MTNKLLIVVALLAIGAGSLLFLRAPKVTPVQNSRVVDPVAPHSEPAHTSRVAHVPKYQTAGEAKDLEPTLPATQFIGKTREAYTVAKEIPQTLAQLPCYCHCDQAFGHKSLHSCFVDNHASQCAVCVDEALLAYKLQREERMTPEQVREEIIRKYGADH